MEYHTSLVEIVVVLHSYLLITGQRRALTEEQSTHFLLHWLLRPCTVIPC